jgi:glycosyltransferase involved in cell wall biosynthesis
VPASRSLEIADGAVDCSVLVPVLNESAHIESAMRSILSQQFPGRLEFLALDGGSADGTRELLAEIARTDGRLRLVENPSGATPAALNIGLRHARGTWVARMDAHSDYPGDYLERAIERLARGDTPWVSGPMIPTGYNAVSRATELAIGTPLGSGATRKWQRSGAPAEYELDSGVFCGVWSRQTLLDLGGWDERWLRNQDSELAARLLARGERLVCLTQMGARYAPRGSLKALWRQYRQYGEYRLRTAVAHPHTLRRSHLLAPGVVAAGATAVGAPAGLRRLARAGISVYGVAVAAQGLLAARRARRPLDAALVPAVLATMHLGHGTGFWVGLIRNGAPVAALLRIAGLARLTHRETAAPAPVHAPSLIGSRIT